MKLLNKESVSFSSVNKTLLFFFSFAPLAFLVFLVILRDCIRVRKDCSIFGPNLYSAKCSVEDISSPNITIMLLFFCYNLGSESRERSKSGLIFFLL